MNKLTPKVDWYSYAQTYDMLMAYNPFYQQLHADVLEQIKSWKISAGDVLVDIGAGTGNYSIKLAKMYPEAKILHVELNRGMNAMALQKKENLGLKNLDILSTDINELNIEPESISACICIHALYTFPKPDKVLQDIFHWSKERAHGLFVDPGRIVNVLDWQLAIGWRLIKNHGIQKTMELLRKGKEISYQNRQIRKYQADGTYWTHSHEEFQEAIQKAGFKIMASKYCFRKVSDMVIARKNINPPAAARS